MQALEKGFNENPTTGNPKKIVGIYLLGSSLNPKPQENKEPRTGPFGNLQAGFAMSSFRAFFILGVGLALGAGLRPTRLELRANTRLSLSAGCIIEGDRRQSLVLRESIYVHGYESHLHWALVWNP